VRVDPIKPTLKAPGTGRLKLKCVKLLSNFALNFSLRRYTMECHRLCKRGRLTRARRGGAVGESSVRALIGWWADRSRVRGA